MAYFFCRLVPPRPSFAQDMNEAERRVMQEHVVYWTGFAKKGNAVLFGPVADPKGPWGLGVFEVENEAELKSLIAGDPAIVAGIGAHYETYPMPRAVVRDSLQQVA
jgi:uncharacterized protein